MDDKTRIPLPSHLSHTAFHPQPANFLNTPPSNLPGVLPFNPAAMERHPSVQFISPPTSSRKRRHDEILETHSTSRSEPSWSTQADNSASAPASSSGIRPRLPPIVPQMRYPGDGFDYRRPIMSTDVPNPPPYYTRREPPSIIDLTQDDPPSPPPTQNSENAHPGASRPPRFGRNIINVVDLEQEPARHPRNNIRLPPPDIQWLRSVPRAQIHGYQTRYGRRFHSRAQMLSLLREAERLRQRVGAMGEMAVDVENLNLWLTQGSRPASNSQHPRREGRMDVTLVDVGTILPPVRSPPSYNAPPAAPKGFARAAAETDVVVCPNCDHELGTGDDPDQRQIWVAKACGHVYCGLCTKNRAISRGKKASTPIEVKPFAKCVVPDCDKPVSQPKTMIQIYL